MYLNTLINKHITQLIELTTSALPVSNSLELDSFVSGTVSSMSSVASIYFKLLLGLSGLLPENCCNSVSLGSWALTRGSLKELKLEIKLTYLMNNGLKCSWSNSARARLNLTQHPLRSSSSYSMARSISGVIGLRLTSHLASTGFKAEPTTNIVMNE